MSTPPPGPVMLPCHRVNSGCDAHGARCVTRQALVGLCHHGRRMLGMAGTCGSQRIWRHIESAARRFNARPSPCLRALRRTNSFGHGARSPLPQSRLLESRSPRGGNPGGEHAQSGSLLDASQGDTLRAWPRIHAPEHVYPSRYRSATMPRLWTGTRPCAEAAQASEYLQEGPPRDDAREYLHRPSRHPAVQRMLASSRSQSSKWKRQAAYGEGT